MEALNRANRIRTARAQLKRDLKAGRRNVLDILLDPPAYVHTMKIFDLLLAVPRFGRVKVTKHLSAVRISPSKTLDGMTDRQRRELALNLGASASRVLVTHPVRPDLPVTRKQAEVLQAACAHGSVGVAYLDDIARSLQTSASAVSFARNRLEAEGLVDEFGQPTARGRALTAQLAA